MRVASTRSVPRALAIALTVFLCVPAHVNTATAAGDRGGGAQIDVSARIGGRYREPAGIWVNPCEAPLEFVSERLADDVSQRAWVRVVDGVTEFMWQTYCYDPEEDQRVAATISQFWIANPDPGELIPPLFDYLPDYLDPPEVTWPNMSPEHGWLFVKVPMDFRINNLDSVTLTASVTNVLGTATASVTATPSSVEFAVGRSWRRRVQRRRSTAAVRTRLHPALVRTRTRTRRRSPEERSARRRPWCGTSHRTPSTLHSRRRWTRSPRSPWRSRRCRLL